MNKTTASGFRRLWASQRRQRIACVLLGTYLLVFLGIITYAVRDGLNRPQLRSMLGVAWALAVAAIILLIRGWRAIAAVKRTP